MRSARPGAGQTVLITGGSSGIGSELAKLFAQDGYGLVLTARDHDALRARARELEAREHVPVRIIAQDLARASAPEEIVRELREANVSIEILVNNAGFTTYGPFAQTDLTAQLGMLQVNIVALTQLTGLLIGDMVRRRRGAILNVASTAAFQPGPLMAVYYATKAYVLSFSEALTDELRGSGVRVSALCPGPTQTKFQQRAGIQRIRLMNRGVMEAAEVARAGYRGLWQGRPVVIPGFRNRATALAVRVVPRNLVVRVVRWIQESRRGS